ncbi:hypothetical protein D623_10034437 [Myotis brandtii]|uniref:Uncharacterized protein n=1 Tax=Myotis brandtii TaxID=109478 RepID=S7MX82_MYOBR|nr:hypothetical protein D623_10034437 [Myotis brandtii]
MRLNPHCVPQLSAACPRQSKAWVKLDRTLLRKPRDASLSKHCANRQWPEGKPCILQLFITVRNCKTPPGTENARSPFLPRARGFPK